MGWRNNSWTKIVIENKVADENRKTGYLVKSILLAWGQVCPEIRLSVD